MSLKLIDAIPYAWTIGAVLLFIGGLFLISALRHLRNSKSTYKQ